MATEDLQAREPENVAPNLPVESGLPATATISAKGASRRRFARAGAGATGVLLTLHSTPGMACTYCGISASGAVSAVGQGKAIGTLSHHGPAPKCQGVLPSVWATATWPVTCAKTDLFSRYFPCPTGSDLAKANCLDIIKGTATATPTWSNPRPPNLDPTTVCQYMMAAYLNILSNKIDFMTYASLRTVWDEYISKGVYAPMAGQSWNAAQIAGYLRGTMD